MKLVLNYIKIVTIGVFIFLVPGLKNLEAQDVKVKVIEIRSEIDPRSARYVKLALAEAEEENVDYVIADINTYGGRVDNADEIATLMLEFNKPVYAFINNNAASAGAWISIACDSIYMVEGATIGAATVVVGDGQAAPDKYQSYMRGKMRSTASARGRDPKIAEAMVDPNLEIEGVIEYGKVITFSTNEAIQHGYCEARVNSIEDILARNNIKRYSLDTYELSYTEKIIQIFLNPFLSGILLLVIIGGIYFELQTPGMGFPIVASLIAATLYFIPYYLNGLAENWEVLLFGVGLLLLALEAFVIPGFGVAGIAGMVVSVGALMLMMVNNDGFDFQFVLPSELFQSFLTVLVGVAGGIALVLYAMPQIMSSKRFQQISLQYSQSRDEGYNSNTYTENLIGKLGTARTVLRPSGRIDIDGEIYDAYTQGSFVEKGAQVEVISQEGTSLKVRLVQEAVA